ncbi:NAD(P)/FAD-dependent oxidoreductase [Gymnodinialimonas ceratoperidinii]|uniref:NAD(P)/FAD-dependent oxidoreductase n=1 Tax=Gymnodinialimonas ceratoperidinii TaxID=2856823 RepID=A0A8F6TX15_9RHOB|nr:NAD(P)/FAD-dependent oxidoreductase [Gymnodinialimonas ceratoperidinii]QXT39494.1 NAD(P)/FAD-dependent oxidoreductase [Gymnodinialimonas ceratoperidinii]
MTDEVDLIIVGAGPAGMAAARTMAKNGARVLLLDEQQRPGGQIYRGLDASPAGYLGRDYAAGAGLIASMEAPEITYEGNARVWRIEDGPRVLWSRDGETHVSAGRALLLAGGAQERPVPFPGWTLPGVMSAGAAQILMKSAGMLPRGAILAGSGPLLYLVALQLIHAGAPPVALVETQTKAMMARAAWHLPGALRCSPVLVKGLGLLRRIRAAGVTRFTGARDFCAEEGEGGDVTFRFTAKGRAQEITAPLLLTHHGVVPSTHMSRAAGVSHRWNETQQAYQPEVDALGRTNVAGVHIAGDAAGIAGAEAAAFAGELAALDILRLAGKLSDKVFEARAEPVRVVLKRARAVRPFLDAAYAPPAEVLAPVGETIVCRCEEVTAEEIRRSVAEGAQGPRQVKTATRAGMGPCQGRMCELAVRGIIAECGGTPDLPRTRSPIKPVSLGEMAALAQGQPPSD